MSLYRCIESRYMKNQNRAYVYTIHIYVCSLTETTKPSSTQASFTAVKPIWYREVWAHTCMDLMLGISTLDCSRNTYSVAQFIMKYQRGPTRIKKRMRLQNHRISLGFPDFNVDFLITTRSQLHYWEQEHEGKEDCAVRERQQETIFVVPRLQIQTRYNTTKAISDFRMA